MVLAEKPSVKASDGWLFEISTEEIHEGIDSLFAPKGEPEPPPPIENAPREKRLAGQARKSNFRPLDKRESFQQSEREGRRKNTLLREWRPRNPSEHQRFKSAGINPSWKFHPLDGVQWAYLQQAIKVLAWHRGLWLVETGYRDTERTQAEWTNRLRSDTRLLIDWRYGDTIPEIHGKLKPATRPDWLTPAWLDKVIDKAASQSWTAIDPRDAYDLVKHQRKATRNKDTRAANQARSDKKVERETRIVEMVEVGYTTKEIGRELGIHVRTVQLCRQALGI